MKRLAALLIVVSASLVLLADAAAARLPRSPFRLLQLARTAADPILIPSEWDGIWAISDTTYDCDGVPQLVSATDDTLCSGAVFIDPDDLSGTMSCTGTITATTIDITCAGADTLIEDCVGTFSYNIRGTRSGNDAFLVATFSSTFDGTAPECDFFPDDCSQVNSHGQRTGPAPAAYCATPTLPSTWGGVKIRYR